MTATAEVTRPGVRSARGRIALRRAIACAALWGASVAFAADDNQIIYPGASRGDSPAKAVASSFNSLSLVVGVGLAAAGGWLLWRNRRGKPVGREFRALAIDETRSLGNRQYLVVASYEGKKFLLGVCPGRIDMLTSLDGSTVRPGGRE